MKKLLVLLLLILAFVFATPMLIDEPGYISIAMGGMIYELTVYTASFWIIFVFLIVILLFVLIRGGFRLSLGTWNKVAFAGKKRGVKDFDKGVAAYILEDYVQAEHLLAKSAEPSDRERSGYLLASAAAAKQDLRANTKHYLGLLDSIGNNVKNGNIESVIVSIKLLIDHEEFEQARLLIDEHHKFLGHDSRLLSLEIDLCIIEERFMAAVEHLVAARKQKLIAELQITQWEEQSFYGVFSQLIKDQSEDSLTQYWNNLSGKVKQREVVILMYCKVLAENNIVSPLNKLLLPVFKKGANISFLKAIRLLPISHADELISIVQKHLKKEEHSPIWLSCLAHLAVSSKQLDMAEKAFNGLVNLPDKHYDNVDLLAFVVILEQKSLYETAIQVYKKIHV